MKIKTCMMLLGFMLCEGAVAQSQDFVKIGDTEIFDLYLNRGAYEFSALANGKPIFGTVVQYRFKATNKSSFFKNYVLKEDCQRGYGKMRGYDLNDRFSEYLDWVKGSGTVGSDYAEALCRVASWDK